MKHEVSSFKPRKTAEPLGRNLAVRIVVVRAKAQLERITVMDVAVRDFPDDELLLKAVSGPATLLTPAWAGVLGQTVTADLLKGLSTHSASADILRLSLQTTFNGAAAISLPGFGSNDVTTSRFIADGDPISVYQGALVNPSLITPHKLAGIFVVTREMMESSNAEQIIGDMMMRSMSETLDQIFFDDLPADDARPAGIRNGIATTAASVTTDFEQAALEDGAALIDAIGNVSGNSPVALVGSPGTIFKLLARLYGQPESLRVFSSSTLDFTVNHLLVAVATNGIAAAFSVEPDIEIGKVSSLHMDTQPQPLLSAGSVRSLFQTESMAMKIRWPISWVRRDPRAVAWTTPTGW